MLGFPDSSAGKESTCNARDPGSIPGSGRSAGEGKGHPLQYSGLENSTDNCPTFASLFLLIIDLLNSFRLTVQMMRIPEKLEKKTGKSTLRKTKQQKINYTQRALSVYVFLSHTKIKL